MVSLFQHTALLRRPLEVTHLLAEGGFQEKTNMKKCFMKAAYAGGVGLNKQAKRIPRCLHLQNPGEMMQDWVPMLSESFLLVASL